MNRAKQEFGVVALGAFDSIRTINSEPEIVIGRGRLRRRLWWR